MSNYSDSHQFLAIVSAVHHQRVGQSLDDRALCFSESLCGISTGGVGDVNGLSDLDVITTIPKSQTFGSETLPLCDRYVRQGNISDFNVLVAPFVEQFYATNLCCDFFREDCVGVGGNFHFDFTVVRHSDRLSAQLVEY